MGIARPHCSPCWARSWAAGRQGLVTARVTARRHATSSSLNREGGTGRRAPAEAAAASTWIIISFVRSHLLFASLGCISPHPAGRPLLVFKCHEASGVAVVAAPVHILCLHEACSQPRGRLQQALRLLDSSYVRRTHVRVCPPPISMSVSLHVCGSMPLMVLSKEAVVWVFSMFDM